MVKKSTDKVLSTAAIETTGKKIAAKAVSEVSKWSTKKKIIGALMLIMIICVINCFFSGSAAMEASQSAIHEIEALLYYVLAAINCCSTIILGVMFEKE